MDITFILDKSLPFSNLIPLEFYPIPASKEIPEWYKKMSSSLDISDPKRANETSTMKRCMPIFDAITTGYLIKTFTDIVIEKQENGSYKWSWALPMNETSSPIETHPGFQMMNYKDIPNILGSMKFTNPFGIITPKGYSCLFMNPPHRPDWGGSILEGIVDTDYYHSPVNFPFFYNLEKGVVPAGTPIALVLPFKRESWKMRIGSDKDFNKLMNSRGTVRSVFIQGYKNFLRQKKEFK
jgi:hypothetical protein